MGCSVPSRQTYEDSHQLQLLLVRPGIIEPDIHGLEFTVYNGTPYLVDEITVVVIQQDYDKYFGVPIIIRPYLEPGQTGIFYVDADLDVIGDCFDQPLNNILKSAKRRWYAARSWNDREPIIGDARYRNWFEIVAYRSRGLAER